MKPNLRSLLCGAAVAAFVIAPTLPGFGQTTISPSAGMPAAPSLPAPPPAPPAPPMPPMPHVPHDAGWATAPARSFNANSVRLEDIVGTLTVAVRDNGPMTVEVSGNPHRVKQVSVSEEDGRVIVDGSSSEEDKNSVWDWKNWFNFSNLDYDHHGNLFVKVTVPRGADVHVQDLVGDVTIGDTMGALNLEAAATKAHIGKVESAKISIGGSGRVDITSVQNDLNLDSGGSGRITVGSAGSVKADIAGSGDAHFGPIAGGMSLDIAGSGDVTAARVNGPVHLDIAGSGTVHIADGIANPLHVSIMGAGNLYFGGVAVDPHIEAVGSGTVRIKAYRGKLNSEGMADVKIGE
jgi:hypothetical protein